MTTAIEPLVYKAATEPWELEQIHRLNYQTFVEEIPQHQANQTRRLVDKFDGENTYFICRRHEEVLGMVAVRGTRPWSLDAKLPNVDDYLPPGRRFCEVRLLAVAPGHRGGPIFRGLMGELVRHVVEMGFAGAVISGTVRQRQLYDHLGFIPFGPLVGSADAPYQPMYITIEALRELRVPFTRPARTVGPPAAVSFLPGPVDIHPDVLAAVSAPPVSHRDSAFLTDLALVKETLCAIVGASNVEILLGSGTLANDVVAGQLSRLSAPGLVLANGEFGDRLIDHATRAGLVFDAERFPWGVPIDRAEIDRVLTRHAGARWVWLVHLETSTGVLNDVSYLVAQASERGIDVAADCVSAVGTVPVDASRLQFATAVSGKGIASLPGLAMVFHRGGLARHPRLPRYLDLALYAEADSVPFTHSSNLVRALAVAARRTLARGRFADVARLAPWLRQELRARGLTLVAPDAVAAPGIGTIALGEGESSTELGDALRARGFALNYRSGYLKRRNWIQIALMGECSREKVRRLLAAWDDARQRFSNT